MAYLLQAKMKKYSLSEDGKNGVIFEEVGISQEQRSLLKIPLFLFPFVSKVFSWYSC